MIYDITRPLAEDIRVYDGHEQYRLEKTRSIERDGYNLSHFSMGAHCGSHLDAPAHFIEGGATTDAFPKEWMCTPSLLVTTGSRAFGDLPSGIHCLLLKSSGEFEGLSQEDARVLIRKGVRLIGTDRLSVAKGHLEAPVHKTLLSANVWIVENLDLSAPEDGLYEFVCLPLSVVGVEGAPVRALLRR